MEMDISLVTNQQIRQFFHKEDSQNEQAVDLIFASNLKDLKHLLCVKMLINHLLEWKCLHFASTNFPQNSLPLQQKDDQNSATKMYNTIHIK